MLNDKKILIGISAGISAYKVYELIRFYRKNNAQVKVILTPNALNFVNVLTLQTLSGNKVHIEQFDTDSYSPEHIKFCDWADIMVIAPATANTIGKIANGICDNLLTSIVCAYKKTILLAPAMNTGMWENQFVQENIEKLKNNNFEILEPNIGYLACGTTGVGRMSEAEEIFEKTVQLLTTPKRLLTGKKILITAGGTRENIDPVRYISNYSSGKMGTALANAANALGANVTLITTMNNKPVNGVKVVNVNTAIEMQSAIETEFTQTDCLIMAAAVADYRVENISSKKIKKAEDNDNLVLELTKNPDILSKFSQQKNSKQIVAGFCAETENLIENAKNKILRKKCDYIIANDVSNLEITFGKDENEVFIIDKELNVIKLEKDTKYNIAKSILEHIFDE